MKDRTGQDPNWLPNLLSSMVTQIWTWLGPLFGPLALIAFFVVVRPLYHKPCSTHFRMHTGCLIPNVSVR